MKALVCRDATLAVEDVPDPVPQRGHVLLDVVACGICGSDLHARHHGDALADDAATAGYDGFMRSDQSVVMGHEFSGTVLEHGPRTSRRLAAGTPVVAFPLLRTAGAVHTTGLSVHAPGGYAEQVLAQESLTFAVPNGLDPAHAALTEPMAVALHAVRRGQVGRRQQAVVLGCGPIGLGVIAMLKATGVGTVVASDYSPGRRALAERMGADVVVDPAERSPFSARPEKYLTASKLFDTAVDATTSLRAVPLLPWATVMRTATRLGAAPSGPVVFECVGVPGMLDGVLAEAPIATRVVVVGVCMEPDRIRPSIGINKEIDLRFVLGYTPDEFHSALHLLAEGKVDVAPLVTGRVDLDGAAQAFDDLADPERHAKILVTP